MKISPTIFGIFQKIIVLSDFGIAATAGMLCLCWCKYEVLRIFGLITWYSFRSVLVTRF